MSIIYLWQNRVNHPLLSKNWFKQWAKRVLTLPSLMEILTIKLSLKISGARIHSSSVISSKRFDGHLKYLCVGEYTFIGRVQIAIHENVTIGSYVVISDGVKLLTASHNVNDPSWGSIAKPIIIDDYAWIATDAIILPGVHIGRGAVVGAGAVVSKDIPDYGISVGNPSKLLEKQRINDLNYNPVHLVACYGAWLGNSESNQLKNTISD
jgi:maltose O-acetyltransferase